MGYGYGSSKRSRGHRRARRAAWIASSVVGLFWFLLGYAAFEQIKPVAEWSLLKQIGLFLAIGMGLIVVVWGGVRLVGPLFFRHRGSDFSARPGSRAEAEKTEEPDRT